MIVDVDEVEENIGCLAQLGERVVRTMKSTGAPVSRVYRSCETQVQILAQSSFLLFCLLLLFGLKGVRQVGIGKMKASQEALFLCE